MSNEHILVDTRTIVTLLKAFQNGDGLDLLFTDGRLIVLLENAIEELRDGPHGVEFDQWC